LADAESEAVKPMFLEQFKNFLRSGIHLDVKNGRDEAVAQSVGARRERDVYDDRDIELWDADGDVQDWPDEFGDRNDGWRQSDGFERDSISA
jgi:hypothetical protein